jgi:hypothetical protein
MDRLESPSFSRAYSDEGIFGPACWGWGVHALSLSLFHSQHTSYVALLPPHPLRIHDIFVWIRIRIRWSMPLTNGSGSGIRILLFSSLTLKMPTINKFLFFLLSAYYFLKVHLHHFSKIKSKKETQNSRNQGFSFYFCMMIEGSGSGSGSIPLTSGSGSGSGKPKNMWIRWIWIRIRIRIRNTGLQYKHFKQCQLD